MITTQKQIQELIDRENKMSGWEKFTRWIKRMFVYAFLSAIITFIGLWFLVAFTDLKFPFLYSENKIELKKTSNGATIKTTRKQVVIDLQPRVTETGIVIKEGKK